MILTVLKQRKEIQSRNTMDNVEDMDDLFTCKWLKQQYYS